MKSAPMLALSAIFALTACGETKHDRELSGAGIGAGTGAVLGAAVAGDPWTGAAVGGVVGGAAGAAVGGLTDSRDLNLGKPIWR